MTARCQFGTLRRSRRGRRPRSPASVRLRELRKEGYPIRLDLSELQFIDSSGIQEIIREVSDARRDGWELEIDGPMTDQVARTVDLIGARALLWPDEG